MAIVRPRRSSYGGTAWAQEARRRDARRVRWLNGLIVAGLIVVAIVVLAGCSGPRPTVDAAPAAAAPSKDPAAQVADTDTCATWTGARFKGGSDPVQVAGAQASWVVALIYEATGRQLGDTNPGDPDRAVANSVADRLNLYCPAHQGEPLVSAVVPAIQAVAVATPTPVATRQCGPTDEGYMCWPVGVRWPRPGETADSCAHWVSSPLSIDGRGGRADGHIGAAGDQGDRTAQELRTEWVRSLLPAGHDGLSDTAAARVITGLDKYCYNHLGASLSATVLRLADSLTGGR